MRVALYILVFLFTLFLVAAAGYGLFLAGGRSIGMIVFVPIIGAADYFLAKHLGIIK